MRSVPRSLIRISMRRWSGSWRGSEPSWLCGLAKRDGTVAGLQVDLWPVAADFAFQARIAVLAASTCFLERGIGDFRVNVVIARLQGHTARCVGDFEIPGARVHTPGKLRDGQVGPLGEKVHTLGDFFQANGPEELAVNVGRAGYVGDAHVAAAPGNFDVSPGAGNMRVSFAHFDADVAARIAHFDIAARCGDRNPAFDAGQVHIAAVRSRVDIGLFGNMYFQVYGAPSAVTALRPDFVAVARVGNGHGNALALPPGFVFGPGMAGLFCCDEDFGGVFGADLD